MICPPPDQAEIWAIAVKVGRAFMVSPQAIFGRSRKQAIARARHAVMAEAHLRGLSYPRIGYILKRDHTTVMHGAKRALERGDVRP